MKKLGALVIFVVCLFAATSAMAITTSPDYIGLYINDNAGNEVFVYGKGGLLSFNDAVGSWNVNVTTILTYPAYGTQAVPRIDFNSINNFAGGQGTLTIMACVTGFDPSSTAAGYNVFLGGTTNGSVEFKAYSSNLSGFFNTTNLIWDSPLFTAGAFSGEFGGSIPAGSVNYTLLAQITSPGPTSFDLDYKVPEPTSLVLLGLGLLGISAIRRKK